MIVKDLFSRLDDNTWSGGVFITEYNNSSKKYNVFYMDYVPEFADNTYVGDDDHSYNLYVIIKNRIIAKYTILVDEQGKNSTYIFIDISTEQYIDEEIPLSYTPLCKVVDEVKGNNKFSGSLNYVFKLRKFCSTNAATLISFPFNSLTNEKIFDMIKHCKVGNSKANIIDTHNVYIDVIA